MKARHKLHQGSALLTALFIMTLIAIVATAMSARLQLDIYRTQLLITYDKLYLAAQAVPFWAMQELSNPRAHFNTVLKQGTVANFPKALQTMQPQTTIQGGLFDMQAHFNLNNLADKKASLPFMNLLKHTALTPPEKTQLALATSAWVSDYDIARGRDAFAAYYLSQKPSYHASHQLMQSPSELRLVQGVTAPLYLALEPLITALPESSTLVNINTASKHVLMALGNGISATKIDKLIQVRIAKPILSLDKIKKLLESIHLPVEQVTTESTYFLSVAHVSYDEYRLTRLTLLQRTRDKRNKMTVKVVQERILGNV